MPRKREIDQKLTQQHSMKNAVLKWCNYFIIAWTEYMQVKLNGNKKLIVNIF